jgi:hypothetical protein
MALDRRSLLKQRGYISPSLIGSIAARRRGGGGGGSAPETDPYFANVVSLLHMDGSDGGTTFTDVTGKTWTANGNAQIDTAQSKFGGSSGLFDGNGDFLSTADSDAWHFGTGDFTVEFWARFPAANVTYQLIGQSDASATSPSLSWMIQRLNTNVIRGNAVSGSSNVGDITGTTTISVDTWYHIAYQRSVDTFMLFVDGVLQGTASGGSPSPSLNNSTTILSVGRIGLLTGQDTNGWIDELRITKGVARYIGSPTNFTPRTSAFPDS